MAQGVAVCVEEHLRHGEELGDQLLHVRRGAVAAAPRRRQGEEEAVGAVEGARLEADGQRREGLLPEEVVQDEGRGGVVRAVHEGREALVQQALQGLVALQEEAQAVGVEGAHGLAQVAERLLCVVWVEHRAEGWCGVRET